MALRSWQEWDSTRASNLDEIEAAHRGIGGSARGRRYATEQINHAYAVLLASQFQGFCRDLHSECVDFMVRAVAPTVATVAPAVLQSVLRAEFFLNRGLDRGNANPSTIGADFNRLGVDFWPQVYKDYSGNDRRRESLDNLNTWRNAIAHQDFDPGKLGGTTTLRLLRVRKWRKACNRLALSFDNIMHGYIVAATGSTPW
jgi:hypothetical protein